MIYIIDGNNLAGKLKMLGQADFDRKLIYMLKEYNRYRQRRFMLVFDGDDRMGDKAEYGNITIVRSPKDEYFASADDKIIEQVQLELGLLTKPAVSGEQITVITDDMGLAKRVEEIMERFERKLFLMRATVFADKLLKAKSEDVAEKNLSNDEMDKISREMLGLWNK